MWRERAQELETQLEAAVEERQKGADDVAALRAQMEAAAEEKAAVAQEVFLMSKRLREALSSEGKITAGYAAAMSCNLSPRVPRSDIPSSRTLHPAYSYFHFPSPARPTSFVCRLVQAKADRDALEARVATLDGEVAALREEKEALEIRHTTNEMLIASLESSLIFYRDKVRPYVSRPHP